jgi:hypothetical protein
LGADVVVSQPIHRHSLEALAAPWSSLKASNDHAHGQRLAAAARDAVARAVAVVGLVGVALIHLLDAHDTFVEATYKAGSTSA